MLQLDKAAPIPTPTPFKIYISRETYCVGEQMQHNDRRLCTFKSNGGFSKRTCEKFWDLITKQ
jgi:hypothetical protein